MPLLIIKAVNWGKEKEAEGVVVSKTHYGNCDQYKHTKLTNFVFRIQGLSWIFELRVKVKVEVSRQRAVMLVRQSLGR